MPSYWMHDWRCPAVCRGSIRRLYAALYGPSPLACILQQDIANFVNRGKAIRAIPNYRYLDWR